MTPGRWITLDAEIRALLAERMERGASEELDRRLAPLIEEQQQIERAGWFN